MASPTRKVPLWTIKEAIAPLPLLIWASMTMPNAFLLGLARSSNTSASNNIRSKSSSIPLPVSAETPTTPIFPPQSSDIRSSSANCFLTRSGSAAFLSILFKATTIGTLAARAWAMASWVCGMTPSSAATTKTTISVTWAPRARMAVKAS